MEHDLGESVQPRDDTHKPDLRPEGIFCSEKVRSAFKLRMDSKLKWTIMYSGMIWDVYIDIYIYKIMFDNPLI